MTLDEFTAAVIARLPATASWRFSEQGGLLVASHDPACIIYDPELDRWSVALDGDTYPLRARSLDDAHASAARRHRSAFLVARDLGLLPWTPHPQTALEAHKTDTP